MLDSCLLFVFAVFIKIWFFPLETCGYRLWNTLIGGFLPLQIRLFEDQQTANSLDPRWGLTAPLITHSCKIFHYAQYTPKCPKLTVMEGCHQCVDFPLVGLWSILESKLMLVKKKAEKLIEGMHCVRRWCKMS